MINWLKILTIDSSDLLEKADYNTKITEIENEIPENINILLLLNLIS